MSRKYGSMGYTYKDFARASGMNENTIMECVRFLEPDEPDHWNKKPETPKEKLK